MSNARKPKSAARVEALEEAVQFEYDGRTYEIRPTAEWSLDTIEAAEDGKAVTFVRNLLGADQWAAFKAKPRTAADLEALSKAMAEAAGLGN